MAAYLVVAGAGVVHFGGILLNLYFKNRDVPAVKAILDAASHCVLPKGYVLQDMFPEPDEGAPSPLDFDADTIHVPDEQLEFYRKALFEALDELMGQLRDADPQELLLVAGAGITITNVLTLFATTVYNMSLLIWGRAARSVQKIWRFAKGVAGWLGFSGKVLTALAGDLFQILTWIPMKGVPSLMYKAGSQFEEGLMYLGKQSFRALYTGVISNLLALEWMTDKVLGAGTATIASLRGAMAAIYGRIRAVVTLPAEGAVTAVEWAMTAARETYESQRDAFIAAIGEPPAFDRAEEEERIVEQAGEEALGLVWRLMREAASAMKGIFSPIGVLFAAVADWLEGAAPATLRSLTSIADLFSVEAVRAMVAEFTGYNAIAALYEALPAWPGLPSARRVAWLKSLGPLGRLLHKWYEAYQGRPSLHDEFRMHWKVVFFMQGAAADDWECASERLRDRLEPHLVSYFNLGEKPYIGELVLRNRVHRVLIVGTQAAVADSTATFPLMLLVNPSSIQVVFPCTMELPETYVARPDIELITQGLASATPSRDLLEGIGLVPRKKPSDDALPPAKANWMARYEATEQRRNDFVATFLESSEITGYFLQDDDPNKWRCGKKLRAILYNFVSSYKENIGNITEFNFVADYALDITVDDLDAKLIPNMTDFANDNFVIIQDEPSGRPRLVFFCPLRLPSHAGAIMRAVRGGAYQDLERILATPLGFQTVGSGDIIDRFTTLRRKQ